MRTRLGSGNPAPAGGANPDPPWSRLPTPGVRLLFGLALLSVACTGSGDELPAPPLAVRDSGGVRIVTVKVDPDDVPRWELRDPPQVIVRGGDEGATAGGGERTAPPFEFLGSAAWLDDGRIVVADTRAGQLHLFDPSGHYLRSLGGKGEGPGEFRALGSVSVALGDSLFVYDPALDRLSLLHPDAGFVRSLRFGEEEDGLFPPREVLALPSGRLAAHRDRTDLTADRSRDPAGRLYSSEDILTLHDPTGRLVAPPLPFATSYGALHERGTFRMPFANDPFMTVCDGRVVVGGGEDWRLFFVDEEGHRTRELRWPARREPIPADEIEAIRKELGSSGLAELPDAGKVLETTLAEELLPEHRPALEVALCGSGGRLWAGRFEPGISLSSWWPTRWDVMAPDGRPLGRLRLPPRTRLVAVDGDRVMVVARDAVDVEEVRIHRVGPAGDGEGSSR